MSTLAINTVMKGRSTWHTYLSRIVEKGPVYPLAALDAILTDLDLSGISSMQLWTDGPSTFKNRIILGGLGVDCMSKWGFDRVQLEVGAPKHFKAACDSHFATLSMFRRMAVSRQLDDVSDLVQLYQELYTADVPRPHCDYVFKEFLPQPKKDYLVTALTVDSCMGIANSFSWTFTKNDRRRPDRRSWHGRGVNYSTLTGLTIKNLVYTGNTSTPSRTGFPAIDFDWDILNDCTELDPEDLAAETSDIGPDCHVRSWQGWRTSYQKADHTLSSRAGEKRRAHLRRQGEDIADARRDHAEARRHRSHEDRLGAHAMTIQKDKVRKTIEKDFVAARRAAHAAELAELGG